MKKEREAENGNTGYGELIEAYVRYEVLQGKRSTRKLPYQLKPFFDYLEAEGLSLIDMNYYLVHELQTWFATLEDKKGDPRYAALTVKSMMHCLRNFYEFLKIKGEVMTNPFLNVDLIQGGETLPRNLPDEATMAEMLDELKGFGNHAFLRDRRRYYKLHIMAEVLYSTGLRVSELASLKAEDIDFDNRLVAVREGKGGKPRKAFLNDYAASVLKHYIHTMREWVILRPNSPYLFGVKDGRTLDAPLNKGLKEIGGKYGIERFTCHAVRHTLGFHLLRRGCDIRYIQLVLGHDDMESTSLYTKVEKRDLRSELDRCHPRRFRGEK